MTFRDAFPILYTVDVERAAAFYCDQLGFERGYRFPPDGPPAFVVVSLGALSLGLTQTSDEEELRRSGLWLYTDDVDGAVARLRRAGANVVREPADMEWGERMATVADPDGVLVHIGSRHVQ